MVAPLAITPTTSWSQQWYPDMVSTLIQISGNGYTDIGNGGAMPNLSAVDTVALLGLVTPALIRAIEKYAKDYNELDKEKAARNSQYVNSDGKMEFTPAELSSQNEPDDTPALFLDAKSYIALVPDLSELGMTIGDATIRYVVDGTGTPVSPLLSYMLYRTPRSPHDQNGTILSFLRQAVTDWQKIVNASSACLYNHSADTTEGCGADELSEFMGSLRAFCADMDVLAEDVPEVKSFSDAVHYAAERTSEFVGKQLATISEEVGKMAGIVGSNVASGFLENAGLLSIVVVAIAIKLFVS